MKTLRIAQFISLFEKTYDCDILDNRAEFVSAYNAYRHKAQPTWGSWSWEPYEHYVRIPNHTRTQYGEGITQKHQKAVAILPKNVINRVLTHE